MSLNFGRSAAVAAFALTFCASSLQGDAPRPTEEKQAVAQTVAERLQPSATSLLAAPRALSPDAEVAEEKPGPEETSLRPVGRSSAVPLIAAGLVLLVSGAIVDGDAGTLLMVGGAGITAYGVYLYVQ